MHDYKQIDVEKNEQREEPCNLWRRENIAIAMAYFSVGVVDAFTSTPLNIYMVEKLNAEPEMQSTIGILQALPWSLKLAFGFLSDACPIRGMRRKPYLTMGALLYSSAFIFYALCAVDNVVLLAACIFLGTLGLIQMDVMADTMCVERSRFEPEATRGQMQASCYSIRFAGSLLGAIMGTSVCNQAEWGWSLTFRQVSFINGMLPFLLVVPWLTFLQEKYYKKKISAHHEIELGVLDHDGHTVHVPHDIAPATADAASSTTSTSQRPAVATVHQHLLANSNNNSNSTSSTGDRPPYRQTYSSVSEIDDDRINGGNDELYVTDLSPNLNDAAEVGTEADHEEVQSHSIHQQLNDIWMTVQLQAVWRPMAFVYLFNIMQIPNVAWQSFLQLSLNFQPWVLGLTVTLGSFMTFAGVLAYKYFFFKTCWRKVYIWSTLMTTTFSFLQLILIFQINQKYLHLNNYFFSLGDDVITAYISGIQFLPLCIMYSSLCPDGAEGSAYSMLTTFGNIAIVCASNIGNLLSKVWDVSNDAMRRHDISGLWRLSVLTSAASVLPLTLIWLLPKSPEEQAILAKSKSRSKVGGAIFLSVLFLSLTWTITEALMNLYFNLVY